MAFLENIYGVLVSLNLNLLQKKMLISVSIMTSFKQVWLQLTSGLFEFNKKIKQVSITWILLSQTATLIVG